MHTGHRHKATFTFGYFPLSFSKTRSKNARYSAAMPHKADNHSRNVHPARQEAIVTALHLVISITIPYLATFLSSRVPVL